MSKLIKVGNLSDSSDNLSLLRLFEAHGIVRNTVVSRHVETGRGVGFVEMESEEAGTAAIAALNQREHFGRVLSVCWSDAGENEVADQEQMFGPMNMPSDRTRKEESD